MKINIITILVMSILLHGCLKPKKKTKRSGDQQSQTEDVEKDPSPKDQPIVDEQSGPQPQSEAPSQLALTSENVMWKRQKALENDLAAALELDKSQLCNELGLYSCTEAVHIVALGGHNPIRDAQYEPSASPTSTTPIAIERLALSACQKRVESDKEGSAIVFKHITLSGNTGEISQDQAKKQFNELYQRLLNRDAEESELMSSIALLKDPSGQNYASSDFALLACFSVATHIEFLFY